MVMTGMSLDEIKKIWKSHNKYAGVFKISNLKFKKDTGLKSLANYMIKNHKERFKEDLKKNKSEKKHTKIFSRSYSPSKNLKKPVVMSEKIIKSSCISDKNIRVSKSLIEKGYELINYITVDNQLGKWQTLEYRMRH